MRIFIAIQRLMAITIMVIGGLLFISETPITESLWNQVLLTGGGFLLMLLGFGLLMLTGLEDKWIETSKKTYKK